MPDLTVTLTDAQWEAYQAVNDGISLDDALTWLKEWLSADYQRKLEGADQTAADDISATAAIARATKMEAF